MFEDENFVVEYLQIEVKDMFYVLSLFMEVYEISFEDGKLLVKYYLKYLF